MDSNEERTSSNDKDGNSIVTGQSSSTKLCGANIMDLLAFADTVEGILPKNNPITNCIKPNYDDHESLHSDWSSDEGDESTLITSNTESNSLITKHTLDLSMDNTFDDRACNSLTDHTPNQTLDSVDEHPFDEGIEVELATDSTSSPSEKSGVKEFLGDIAVTIKEDSYKNPSEDLNITATTLNTTLDSNTSLEFSPWLDEEAREEDQKPAALLSSPSMETNDSTHGSKTSGSTNEEGILVDKAVNITVVTEDSHGVATTQDIVEMIGTDINKEKNGHEDAKALQSSKLEDKEHLVKDMTEMDVGEKKKGKWKKPLKKAIGSLGVASKKKGFVGSKGSDYDDESC